ncbi:MAG: hypothetical protein HQM08_21195 [Candidatus Riflebacteria bacterium]|nr:hypothetical protein [Candidatus Riflebacteria bacterium]
MRKIVSNLGSKIFFLICIGALLLTGCGGGGSGGNSPVNPVSPGTGITAVEGYLNLKTAALRATTGTPANAALMGITCELIAFDQSGNEHIISTTTTREDGYYRFDNISNFYRPTNLIVNAKAPSGDMASVLPVLKTGTTEKAPTISTNSQTSVQIIRKVMKKAPLAQFSLGELFAILPQEALPNTDSKIGQVVDNFLTLQEAKLKKIGASNALNLLNFSLELQQSMNEKIENGEISAQDAWKLFGQQLAEKEKSLGISQQDVQGLNDLGQAVVFEPAIADAKSVNSGDPTIEKVELEKLRERKMNFLDTVSASVKVLVKDSADFSKFFDLVATFKQKIETAANIDCLNMVFIDGGSDSILFSDFLAKALVMVNFSPELVGKVFAIDKPIYGFCSTGNAPIKMAENPNSKTVLSGGSVSSDVSNETRGVEIAQKQDDAVNSLINSVQEIAKSANISLSQEQAKAVAWIIWSESYENLNFSPPSTTPTDPTNPPKPGNPENSFYGFGKVIQLTTPVEFNGVKYYYALQTATYWNPMPLIKNDGGEITLMSGSSSNVASETFETVAYLSEKDPINITKEDYASKSAFTGDLKSLVQYDGIQVEGLLLSTPTYQLDSGSGLPNSSSSNYATGNTGTGVGTAGVSSVSSSGSSGPAVIIYPVPPVLQPKPSFALIKTAIIPPPAQPAPPPPKYFTGEKGKITLAEADGVVIPGLFVFIADNVNSECNRAILRQTSLDEKDSWINLKDYLGKPVAISGNIIESDVSNSAGSTSKEFFFDKIQVIDGTTTLTR